MPTLEQTSSNTGDWHPEAEEAKSVKAPAVATANKDREGLSAVLTMLLLAATMAAAWFIRDAGFIRADSGLGYALGITGASMMAVMLIYPLRKRMRSLAFLGSVKHWFRAHMMLGVVGPTLIVLHTNFSLGSTNSRVAFFCMLVVALSGFVGRYLYRQIHRGLYGQRTSLRELQAQSNALRESTGMPGDLLPDVAARLREYEQKLETPPSSLFAAILHPIRVQFGTRVMQNRLRQDVKLALDARARESASVLRQRRRLLSAASRYLAQRLGASRRIANFRVYERLFSLWHVLHIPLFILMVLAVFVHIYAVHAY